VLRPYSKNHLNFFESMSFQTGLAIGASAERNFGGNTEKQERDGAGLSSGCTDI
jgi:hypothetical protein